MPDEVNTDAGTGGVPAAGGGNAVSSAVPKGLEKFTGSDGKVDYAKVSQAYLDAEKKATDEAQKRTEAERAYQMAITGFGPTPASGAIGGDGRGSATGDDIDDADPVTNAAAKPVVQKLLILAHPELDLDAETGEPKNPKFYDGLLRYMRSLPASTQAAIKRGDFQATEWSVRSYKAFSGMKTNSVSGGGVGGARPNFVEGGSPTGGAAAGTSYSRSEIRKMMLRNPEEYARISDDYGKALEEGRTKD